MSPDTPKPSDESSSFDLTNSGSQTFEISQEQLTACLPDYEIRGVVGSGAMGVVFEANHKPLQRRVALKVLPPGLAAREQTILRFLREAEVVAQIHHENIVPIYDVGSRAGLHYIAMRFVPGVSLDRAVAVAPLSPTDVAKVGSAVARALACAHSHGIVHRDVKPANILREPDGRVVLTDFGLARVEGNGTMTESGALVGTPNYMSPEQVSGSRDEIGGRSDIYALGVTLFELLTGRPPFQESTTAATLRAILERSVPRLKKVRPDCPEALERILDKAMRKNPADRYPNATALAEDLERFLIGAPIMARREAWWKRGGRYVRAHQGVFIAGSIAGLLGFGLWGALVFARDRSAELFLSNTHRLVDKASPEEPESITEALAALETAHGNPSTQREACLMRIRFALREGKELLRIAMEDTAHLLAMDPNDVTAHSLRGYVAFRMGEFEEAGLCVRRAQAIAADDPEVLTLAARLMMESGKSYELEERLPEARGEWGLARDWLLNALASPQKFDDSSSVAVTHMELATVYDWLGETEKARKEFEEAKKLDAKNGELLMRIARFEDKTGHPEAARLQEELAKSLDPFFNVRLKTPTVGTNLSPSLRGFGESLRDLIRPAGATASRPFRRI